MQINIDFLVSGCNTRCRHCYVAGGPGPMMAAQDALICIERMDELGALLEGEISFTLDHEPMNHPDIERILKAAAKTKHIHNYHHGMTTGAGLMRRGDREAVVQAYMECGYNSFGITIHGNADHHDEIVRRKGAYNLAADAAQFFKSHGARLEVSLMVNRFFAEDADSISTIIDQLQPDYIGCVIPIFMPHRGMPDFEPYRASLADFEGLRGHLAVWKQDEEEYLEMARRLTVSSAISRLRQGPGLRELFRLPQQELYLSLHQDCRLYVGNSGAETQLIGDLRTMDLEKAAGLIMKLPGNRDYGAFYDAEALPSDDAVIQAMERLPGNLVYGDFESAVYRGLTEIKVPVRMV